MIFAAAVLAQAGTSAMERWLREWADDPMAGRPPYQVLLGPERQGLLALKGMGIVAGLVSVFGAGLVLLGSLDMGGFAEIYRGSDQIFGAYVAPAFGLIGATLLLVLICMGLQVWQTVCEREFRNLLWERCPSGLLGWQRKSDEAKNLTRTGSQALPLLTYLRMTRNVSDDRHRRQVTTRTSVPTRWQSDVCVSTLGGWSEEVD